MKKDKKIDAPLSGEELRKAQVRKDMELAKLNNRSIVKNAFTVAGADKLHKA